MVRKMLIKRNKNASLWQPKFPGTAAHRWVRVCQLASRGLALSALLTQGINPVRAADALPAKKTAAPNASAQKPAYIPKGHQMERYQAFARQAKLPTITVKNQTTLEVGGSIRTDLTRLARLSSQEKEALASQFQVPAGVISKVAENLGTNHPPNAAQFIQDIRTAVVDYRFLRGEWQRYHPPAEGQKVKAEARQALQRGEIRTAWEFYDALPRPAAPTGLRVISQP